jgi:hypothetical protein
VIDRMLDAGAPKSGGKCGRSAGQSKCRDHDRGQYAPHRHRMVSATLAPYNSTNCIDLDGAVGPVRSQANRSRFGYCRKTDTLWPFAKPTPAISPMLWPVCTPGLLAKNDDGPMLRPLRAAAPERLLSRS